MPEKPRLNDRYRIPLLALSVALAAIAVNYTGILQFFEWAIYDQFFRWRGMAAASDRITLVTIDNDDIRRVGDWPIPDGQLAEAIANIASYNPRVIGLGLYRDLPVAPGHRQLTTVMRDTPNLIGIERYITDPIDPPPELAKLNQVAVSDSVIDADGTVRRSLLAVKLAREREPERETLGAALALKYLAQEAEPILPQETAARGWRRLWRWFSGRQGFSVVQLGQASIEPLRRYDGGYVRTDDKGFQILLDYRGHLASFERISLTEILAGPVAAEKLRDRLVIIGGAVEGQYGFSFTPYSAQNRFAEPVPGLIIHANVASQLLTAALDGRGIIRTLPEIIEWLWVAFWALETASALWRTFTQPQARAYCLPRWLTVGLSVAGSMGLPLVAGYGLFLGGWWLPVALPVAANFGAILAVSLYANYRLQRLATADSLTGIANRGAFDRMLNLVWQQSLLTRRPLSLILCDVDFFKLYNDHYGHPAGDACLQQVAIALQKASRNNDFAARYGGEEFVVILPGTTLEAAQEVGDRLCETMSAFQLPHAQSHVADCVTLSCGLASMVADADSRPKTLIDRADAALYRAKKSGRNRAVAATEIVLADSGV